MRKKLIAGNWKMNTHLASALALAQNIAARADEAADVDLLVCPPFIYLPVVLGALRGSPVAVIGPTVRRELFGEEGALGRFVRIGGQRFRVIGVMAPKGQMLGIDLDDSAYLPIASHMQLFNLDELW